MIELKVRKFGDALGVVLPEEAVSRLRAGEGESLFLIETTEGAYQLVSRFAAKMAKAEDIIGRYRNTIHELAR